jgi:hypothetical protein
MPRAKKNVLYDASAEVIKKYFELSWQARDEQKAASGLIAATNTQMAAEGVHPGVLLTMRKIKAMPDGKRGFFVFLMRRYCDVLEQELHDPAFVDNSTIVENAGNGVTVPFDRQTRAA